MKITVFGSTGKVGRLVVTDALKRGHEVVAFIHNSSPFNDQANLKIIKGDIYDPETVNKAVAGSQAVISALGSWGTPGKDILTSGMRNIIPAMKTNNVGRIVSLTGGGANAPDDELTAVDKMMHSIMDLLAHKVLVDGEEHIRLLKDSQLSWTVIRSPIMNELGNSSKYNLTVKRPSSFATINRHSVVQAMVDLAESDNYSQQAPYITR